ncbi:MAG TPA: hypothetical protein VJB96_05590 [Patescibacteria group bacterium]|nr:hypothetical protein [Patescibacteria group bacterium]
MRTILGTLAVIAALLLGIGGFFAYREFITPSPSYPTKPPGLNSSPTSGAIPAITSQERTRGWYWGSKEQKKPGTPDDWDFLETGRSSCWHAPGVTCTETTYTCPENGWENCMPILTKEAQKQCSKEAIAWKKKNCPGFQGAAL